MKLDTMEKQQIEEIKRSGRRFKVTAFTSSHKIVGTAFLPDSDYDESWRSSDFLRSIAHDHMILGEVEMRDVVTGTIVDRLDYVMLSLRSVEVVYAEEITEAS